MKRERCVRITAAFPTYSFLDTVQWGYVVWGALEENLEGKNPLGEDGSIENGSHQRPVATILPTQPVPPTTVIFIIQNTCVLIV